MSGKQRAEQGSLPEEQTLLSYFLKNASYGSLPSEAQPQTLHPYASSPGDPVTHLRTIAKATEVLNVALHGYANTNVSENKLVSILRQSTTLINSLHASEQETRQRIDKLRQQSKKGALIYGEPIPLDETQIAEWAISRIENWGKEVGMEAYKDEEKDGRISIVFGGKVLVIEVDLHVDHGLSSRSSIPRVSVTSVKTSHALPSGHFGNTLAERSKALDSFILETWNRYLTEVLGEEDSEKSYRAAHIADEIQSHLRYLMKLDSLASKEGDQGIRWFNETGKLTAVTEQVMKVEAESLSNSLQVPVVSLDVFLARAHALAVPYLLAPSMTFLVYVSPRAYYALSQASNKSPQKPVDPFSRIDISYTALKDHFASRQSRAAGLTFATLSLVSSATLSAVSQARMEQPSYLGRPFFRLPGTSLLAALDHSFIKPPDLNTLDDKHRDSWVLDFTDGGRLPGIWMSYSRMCEIRQVLEPGSAVAGNISLNMHVPPLSGSWLNSLVNPGRPQSERYGADYVRSNFETNSTRRHPPLRLRLTAPNEAGFLLEKLPVNSLKEVYGVLEVVRDQSWLNEMIKTLNWIIEDHLLEEIEERASTEEDATVDELNALLNGTFRTRRLPINIYLPPEPPALPYSNMGLDSEADEENVVPGLSSISMTTGTTSQVPCVVLLFAIQPSFNPSSGLCQVALVVRHERARRRGIRVDLNFTPSDGNTSAYQVTSQFVDELEERVRRGGLFSLPGKVWEWVNRASL